MTRLAASRCRRAEGVARLAEGFHMVRAASPFPQFFLRINGKTLTLDLVELSADAAIYIAQSPDNPATLKRHTILVRTRAREVTVAARYTVK